MRGPPLLIVFVVVTAGGCRIFSADLPCGDNAGCDDGDVCIDGLCTSAPLQAGEGEGEGDVTGEGEGDVTGEGEGDVGGEGEGDAGEGEGEGDKGEGEGEGEGEGDVGGEGEGDGGVGGEGEGEGEGDGGPVDPCPPILEDEFDGSDNLFFLLQQGPTSTVGFTSGQLQISSNANGGNGSFGVVSTNILNLVGAVIEVDLQMQGSVAGGEAVGISFAADDFPNHADVTLDVVDNDLSFYAENNADPNAPPLQVIPRAFPGGTLTAQFRFDGPNPVARVNGLTATLTALSSQAVEVAHIDLFAGCFNPGFGCDGVTLNVERLRIYGGCRP